MINFHKAIPKILNLIFAIVFFIHVAILGHQRVYPENPSIRVYDKELKDIEFPLSFKLCVRDQDQQSSKRYQNIGYKDIFQFFEGRSYYNSSYVGWTGGDRNKSTTVTG